MLAEAGQAGYRMWSGEGSKRDFNFLEGQWVMIDNGHGVARSDVPGNKDFEGPVWEPQPKVGLRRRMAFVFEGDRDISPGFYMGIGKEENTVRVFNFKIWREQDKFVTNVIPMPSGEVAVMNNNKLMSEVRLLKFKADECSQLVAEAPTDPGTEVLYEGVRYNVVTAAGQDVAIEDEGGVQKNVDVSQLTRGRVTNDTVYNYRPDGTTVGGFLASGEDTIHAGKWLWVGARSLGIKADKELVCVSYIKGDYIHG